MTAEIARRYKIKKNVAFRKIKDEVVIVDTNTNKMMMFNGTASDIWMSLSEGKTVAEIVETLIAEYEVEESAATSDVADFIQTLLEKDLVDYAQKGNHV